MNQGLKMDGGEVNEGRTFENVLFQTVEEDGGGKWMERQAIERFIDYRPSLF